MSRHAVLWIVAVAVVMILPAAQVKAQEGNVYEVVATPSFPPNFSFCDCMRFDDFAPGCLSIDGLGRRQLYAHTNLNRDTDEWQSTYIVKGSTCGMNPPVFFNFGVSFHGQVEGPSIMGDAINDLGITFTFWGVENPDCSRFTCQVDGLLQGQVSRQVANPWAGGAGK